MEYYFFSPEEFKAGIERGDFLEHEEVYPGRYYGTLRSEVDRRIAAGDRVIFDVDCVGGLNIKKGYGHEALSIFIEPPSIEELRRRLVGRSTDSPEVIEERVAKAAHELTYAPLFDRVLTNDDLERCLMGVLLDRERLPQRRLRLRAPAYRSHHRDFGG